MNARRAKLGGMWRLSIHMQVVEVVCFWTDARRLDAELLTNNANHVLVDDLFIHGPIWLEKEPGRAAKLWWGCPRMDKLAYGHLGRREPWRKWVRPREPLPTQTGTCRDRAPFPPIHS